MKKIIILLSIGIILSWVNPSHALVVSDPGAYGKFATQLQEFQKQTKFLQDSLQESKNIYSSLSGNLQRGKGIERDLTSLLKKTKDSTKALHNLPNVDLANFDFNNIDQVQAVIDKLYTSETDIFAQSKDAKYRNLYKQRTIKSALENSEYIINQQDQSYSKIQDLARKIDETKDLKDGMDLMSRILSEILLVDNQQLVLMAQLVRASTADKYEGVNTSGEDDFKNSTSSTKSDSGSSNLGWGKLGSTKLSKENCELFGGCN